MDKPKRTSRSRDYYRHHRKRVIKAKISKFTKGWDKKDKELYLSNPKFVGRFHKDAAYCSCNMCRYEQRNDIPKAKDQAKEKHYDKKIEDYFKGED